MPRNSSILMLNDRDLEYLRSLIKQRTIQAKLFLMTSEKAALLILRMMPLPG